MHELGIAFYIIEDVERVAEENGISHVESVTLSVGKVSGVIPKFLKDLWPYACNDHPIVKGSELICEPIEAVTYCENCGKTYDTIKYKKICPYCNSERTYLQTGDQVVIKEIEVSDSEATE